MKRLLLTCVLVCLIGIYYPDAATGTGCTPSYTRTTNTSVAGNVLFKTDTYGISWPDGQVSSLGVVDVGGRHDWFQDSCCGSHYTRECWPNFKPVQTGDGYFRQKTFSELWSSTLHSCSWPCPSIEKFTACFDAVGPHVHEVLHTCASGGGSGEETTSNTTPVEDGESCFAVYQIIDSWRFTGYGWELVSSTWDYLYTYCF